MSTAAPYRDALIRLAILANPIQAFGLLVWLVAPWFGPFQLLTTAAASFIVAIGSAWRRSLVLAAAWAVVGVWLALGCPTFGTT